MSTQSLDVIRFLAPPFFMCLILVGIHCYLGIHVLARGVIFVDLSLAQVAALGSTFGFLLGYEHHGIGSYLISLSFTLVTAALFALARKHEKIVPQEALIGIVYALCSAAIVLVVDRVAHGAEHIKDVLVGQILWVTWHDVIKTALIYSAVSIVHYIFRKPFLRASFGGDGGKLTSPFWDFLFFALFGVIITSSVSVAGVLQVFSYLIVPATLGKAFFKTVKSQLLFGWCLGVVLSFLGLFLSHVLDYPAGAFIVVCFTVLPVFAVLSLSLTNRIRARST